MTPYLGNEGKKNFLPLEIQAAPEASAATPIGAGCPISPGSCFWDGRARQSRWPKPGGGPLLSEPARHMMGFAAMVNPAGAAQSPAGKR